MKSSSDGDTTQPFALEPQAKAFLASHDLGVLSTASEAGEVAGAAVYYVLTSDDQLFILTRSDTTKARNMAAHPQVAFTIFDAKTAETLQLLGEAVVETREPIKVAVFSQLTAQRHYGNHYAPPPVAQLHSGMYLIEHIQLTKATYSAYDAQ